MSDLGLTLSPIKYVLLDIEGTTTDVNFVHKVLFPYSKQKLPEFVMNRQDDPEVHRLIRETQETLREEGSENPSSSDAVRAWVQWIGEDRKHPALKTLQGWIWKEGYESGAFKSHVYPEVMRSLSKWKSVGLQIGIYSSGSIEAQKLLFENTEQGDLTPYFDHHFDLKVGSKKDPDSYGKILFQIGFPSGYVLFMSDVPAELDAAAENGIRTVQLIRPGCPEVSPSHKTIQDFNEINLTLAKD